jgi:20S proteasome alpha/beta subunit
MTLFIGFQTNDYVLFISDTQRSFIDEQTGTFREIDANNVRKIFVISPTVILATQGLEYEDAIDSIINYINTNNNLSLNDIILYCQNTFRSVINHFHSTYSGNPNVSISFALGGIDPLLDKTFLYTFDSLTGFTQSPNYSNAVKGDAQEIAIKSLSFAKIPSNLVEAIKLGNKTIRITSKYSKLVGNSTLEVIVYRDKTISQKYRDSNNKEIDIKSLHK